MLEKWSLLPIEKKILIIVAVVIAVLLLYSVTRPESLSARTDRAMAKFSDWTEYPGHGKVTLLRDDKGIKNYLVANETRWIDNDHISYAIIARPNKPYGKFVHVVAYSTYDYRTSTNRFDYVEVLTTDGRVTKEPPGPELSRTIAPDSPAARVIDVFAATYKR